MIGLTQEQARTFNDEGMLCIPDFLSPQEISQMMASAHTLLADLDLEKHPKTQFKTKENDHVGDQYFFDSSDKVSYFFDTDAFDANGQLRYPKEQAVNKIGHGLHMHHDVFREITFKEQIKQIARDLHYTDPRVLQSMLIFKNATGTKNGSEKHKKNVGVEGRENSVPVHNDGTFLYTSPQSALGFWFALEDCTPENGCLSYHPGSHKTFPINKRFVRIESGAKGCNMIDLDTDKPMPKDHPDKYRLVECKAGSLILIHNSVLHKLEKNVLGKSRFAYAFHLIDGTAEYDELNWLQVPSTGGSNFLKLYDGN
ncbi:hypothetical protein HF325_000375 [Metschnikowia pulcherrima]|uniref:Phytanoyl-CoA dioxygenase n=1 Tax=Metschnikowia pulcherrima TaxID=27326 RepID=A0A8H7LEK0_9ASCO|nr:hypothetical protein HF325_000375 [Metschnikowia pulcherrima]